MDSQILSKLKPQILQTIVLDATMLLNLKERDRAILLKKNIFGLISDLGQIDTWLDELMSTLDDSSAA
jgi:hypothetical protein